MTIYGTPAGTPLNQTGGFQGTQPGNPVAATLQLTQPGVGLFPPNSNSNSGDSVMAAVSRGSVPANVQPTNALVGLARNRSLAEAMNTGGSQGTSTNPGGGGFDTMNISANGGGGPGGGGLSQDLGSNSGISSQMATPMPSVNLTTGAAPVYQG